MSGSEPMNDRGVVSRQPVVDFSHLTSPQELAAISRIERVAAVIVPESLAAAYAAIPSSRVAATIYVPDGANVNVRVHTGPLIVSGDGLGAAEDVLVVVGVLVITSPVTGVVPRRVSVVGSVLAPRGSEPVLGPILAGVVGSVGYYRYVEGQDVKVLTGQVGLSGTSLANPAGRPDDVLVTAGQVVVTGPVTTVGYAQVFVAGQLVAPVASREVLEPRMQVQGQAAWYRADEPRVFYEDTTVGPDFFRLLDRPVSLILLGDLTIAPDVTETMVREKVTDIALLGDLTAPAELVPVLQVLTTNAFGDIRTDSDKHCARPGCWVRRRSFAVHAAGSPARSRAGIRVARCITASASDTASATCTGSNRSSLSWAGALTRCPARSRTGITARPSTPEPPATRTRVTTPQPPIPQPPTHAMDSG